MGSASSTLLKAAFEDAIGQNPVVVEALMRVSELKLPGWYLGASCLTGTIWNLAHGYEPTAHIKDYDFFYFDGEDLSEQAEEVKRGLVQRALVDLNVAIDVTNVARVHVWFGKKHGYDIPPYRSVEHSIDTWPTTASAVGVRLERDGLKTYAPYGLSDVMSGIVRPNKGTVSRKVYEEKANRWKSHWPKLTVVAWDEVPATIEA